MSNWPSEIQHQEDAEKRIPCHTRESGCPEIGSVLDSGSTLRSAGMTSYVFLHSAGKLQIRKSRLTPQRRLQEADL
jgi:hypothetical protein